jgi:hypothetical protein
MPRKRRKTEIEIDGDSLVAHLQSTGDPEGPRAFFSLIWYTVCGVVEKVPGRKWTYRLAATGRAERMAKDREFQEDMQKLMEHGLKFLPPKPVSE